MRATVAVAERGGQQQLDRWLAACDGQRAVVAENVFAPLTLPADIPLVRLAGGCPCCTGLLPLRAAIGRIARTNRPDALLLLLQSGDHLDRVRELLSDGSLGVRFEVE